MQIPTHLDLFSGIGGFSLAFESVGFKTIGFSEIDPFASAVLKKHWPQVKNYGDIRTIPEIDCDVLTGGFPCQPFSVAGEQRGERDDRYLWPALRDAIKRCGPAWVLCENVAGIIHMGLDRCLDDLENIGYKAQPIIIPACAVDARHRRDRVWILANSLQGRLPESEFKPSKTRTENRTSERPCASRSSRWLPEPELGRVANGIPNRAHRLKCLGNAIVPQVAAEIARCILAVMKEGTLNPSLPVSSVNTEN